MAEHVCPVWIGYLLASPIRRLFQDPAQILAGHLREGMTVLDVGCAMGYFSIPMAKMVGEGGRVVCVDLQPKMLKSLKKRARKAGVLPRIEARPCSRESLQIDDLSGGVDFALAFAMVHEAGDLKTLLGEMFAALTPGGKLLVAEPRGHVSDAEFGDTLDAAASVGFEVAERPTIGKSHAVLLRKPLPN